MFKTLLVPVDGSAHAAKALRVAAQLARGDSARLVLLAVAEFPPENMGLFTGGTPEPFTEEDREKLAASLKKNAREALDRSLEGVDLEGLEVEQLVHQGVPARCIVDEARRLGVDAIVMGSRGLSDLRGMLVGSVSHKVSHVAECTVITVA